MNDSFPSKRTVNWLRVIFWVMLVSTAWSYLPSAIPSVIKTLLSSDTDKLLRFVSFSNGVNIVLTLLYALLLILAIFSIRKAQRNFRISLVFSIAALAANIADIILMTGNMSFSSFGVSQMLSAVSFLCVAGCMCGLFLGIKNVLPSGNAALGGCMAALCILLALRCAVTIGLLFYAAPALSCVSSAMGAVADVGKLALLFLAIKSLNERETVTAAP